MHDWACGNMDAALTAVGGNRPERSRAPVPHLRWVPNSSSSLLIILLADAAYFQTVSNRENSHS